MTTKLDVTKDRDKYIGGSDMPAVMGISPFRTRWDLLQEKALGKVSDFTGNEYTEYGKTMEPIIRDYINAHFGNFVDDEVRVDGDLRYHADGWEAANEMWDGESRLLEIKTTSEYYRYDGTIICDDKEFIVKHYKAYLVQILLGLRLFDSRFGLLAVYKRPDDFSTELAEDCTLNDLQVCLIRADEYADVYAEMDAALDRFRRDRDRLKENPLLTEEELQPAELVKLADKVLAVEQELRAYKALEANAKELRAKLYAAMDEHGVKKWTTPQGVKITRIAAEKDKTVQVFNKDKFLAENADLAAKYTEEKVKKGRAGYVKITF